MDFSFLFSVWSDLGSTIVVTGQKNPNFEPISIRLNKLRSDPLMEFSAGGQPTSQHHQHQCVDGNESTMMTDEVSIAGGQDYPLLIKAFHWKKRGEPELMGSFETTLTELEERARLMANTSDPLTSASTLTSSSSTSSALSTPPLNLGFRLIDPILSSDRKKGRDYQHSGIVFLHQMEVSLKDKLKRQSTKRRTMTVQDVMFLAQQPNGATSIKQ